MSRIYAVKILLPEPKVRLVRAANINAALRHVASDLLYAELATQDALVSLSIAGVKVEEATTPDEPKPAVAAVPTETQTSAATITELPAHMDRRQKAAVG